MKINHKFGFTLIELLLAMGILAFLATASVAILGNFNRNQNIKIAYDDVRNGLAQAKSYALSQVVSDNCDVNNSNKNLREELLGYEVRFDSTTDPAKHSYAIYEICEDPTGAVKVIPPTSTYYLPKDILFQIQYSPIRFKGLTGGAELPGGANSYTVTIRSSDLTQSRNIIVNRNGVIQ